MAEDPKYVAYWEWMARNGPVTRALDRLVRLPVRRGAAVQPAE